MIFDHISRLGNYTSIPGLANVADFLRGHPAETLTPGRYELPDGMWCTVSEPEMRADGPYEIHHRYADVQVLLVGSEQIDYAPVEALDKCLDFSEERDIGFIHQETEEHLGLRLYPGWFTVLYPDDAHKPLIKLEHDHIRKAVFKIPME